MATPSLHARSWADPLMCPFCLTDLEDGGAGFVDHIDTSPVCESGFELWRDRIQTDVAGEWSG